jgi:hypothetical protein
MKINILIESKKFGSTTDTFLVYIFRALILFAPFSLVPYISMPLFGFASFRIGLYQLFLATFVLVSVPSVWKTRRKLIASSKTSLYAFIWFGILVLASLTHDINKSRSLLLIASLMLLLGAVISAWRLFLSFGKRVLPAPALVLRFAMAYGVVSIMQLLVATFTHTNVLLCQGCRSDVFGFARVNGFALEPQFWANALIPFFAYGFVMFYIKHSRLAGMGLFMSMLAIMLTFSRGAFIAVALSLLAFIAVLKYQNSLRVASLARSLGITLVAFIAGFILLVTMSSIKYKNSPNITYNTARGMIEQLTLGRISLPKKENTPLSIVAAPSVPPEQVIVTTEVVTPTNQGVVKASQNDRVRPARTALTVWSGSLRNMLLGVGVGNFAPFVQKNIDASSPLTLTVYIFYVLLLVETGLVGMVLFIIPNAIALLRLLRYANPESWGVIIIITAFLVQYAFFGSYINVAYIWLWLGIALGLGVKSSDKHELSHKKVRKAVSRV